MPIIRIIAGAQRMKSYRTTFLMASGQPTGNTLFYMVTSPSHITIKSARVDFSQRLSKMTNLDAGLKTSQANSDNQIDFNQFVNGNYIPVPELTDHFKYDERFDAAYFQVDSKWNKTSLSIGLRGEKTTNSAISANPKRQVDSNYFNIFPNVQLSQALGKNNQLTLLYSRNINRPNYQDLNPFVGYVDQFYYHTGNPFLQPDYINTYEISDLFMSKYRVSLDMIVTDNYFNTIFEQDDITKVFRVTKANLGTRYQYMIRLTIPVDITSWWNVTTDIDAILTHDKVPFMTNRRVS